MCGHNRNPRCLVFNKYYKTLFILTDKLFEPMDNSRDLDEILFIFIIVFSYIRLYLFTQQNIFF